MSGAFDTLVYTDCRPGMGLSGVAGLQFQARSSGADERAMTLVRNNLLYEPPQYLMHERHPPSEYPPSFAHIWDGTLATAAGLYLGRGISSGREGNQLTHAIVTRDPETYGFVRPAQLFEAPFWRRQPAPSSSCEPLTHGWNPGPLDAMRVQAFVKGHPQGPELLRSLTSALETMDLTGSQMRRVVFVSREAHTVMHWLTAATLLLPQRRALEIGFKVFTGNPAYARHAVVAVHPDWGNYDLALDNDLGYTVVDLIRGEWSTTTPTRSATVWTELFLTENPYDVVDAVEFVAATGLDFEQALPVATAAILGRVPDLATAEAAVGWLYTGPVELVGNYSASIAAAVIGSDEQWPSALLLRLDQAGTAGHLQERRREIRTVLFDTALSEAAASGVNFSSKVAPLPRTLWRLADDERAVAQTLQAIRMAPVDRIEAVLSVAGCFALPLPASQVGPELARFVDHWAARPHLAYEPMLWPCRDEIISLLHERLSATLEAQPERAGQIGQAWWRRLLDSALQLRTSLEILIVAVALSHINAGQRLDIVRRGLAALPTLPALRHVVNHLWAFTAPTPMEARLLTGLLPRGSALDRGAFDSLDQQLIDGDRVLEAMEAGDILKNHGLWKPSPPAARVWAADAEIGKLCHALRQGTVTYNFLSQAVRMAPASLLQSREAQLADAMIHAALASSVLETLKALPSLTQEYQARLTERIADGSDPVYVVMAFLLTSPQHLTHAMKQELDPGFTDSLEHMLRKWVMRASKSRRDMATAQIRNFRPPIPEEWRAMLNRRRSWKRFLPEDWA